MIVYKAYINTKSTKEYTLSAYFLCNFVSLTVDNQQLSTGKYYYTNMHQIIIK